MRLAFGHDATVAGWVAEAYGDHLHQAPAVAIGVVDDDGVIHGAFIVIWKCDTTAELSLYGVTSNDTWKAFFGWLFGVAGVWRLEIRTARGHRQITRAAIQFGFRFEGVDHAYYGPGRDAVVYMMTPDDCRWIDGKSVQEPESADAG